MSMIQGCTYSIIQIGVAMPGAVALARPDAHALVP